MGERKQLPTEKDFSGGAVQRYVFKETIQHPATIIPLGVAGGFTGLMILGLMAVTPITLIVPVVAGLAGGGIWVYNYSIRGREIAERYVQDLRSQLDQARADEIFELKRQCLVVDFHEGAKEAGELEDAYKKFVTYLESRAKTGQDLGAVRYMSLAKDNYREGVKLLRSALEAHKALRVIDINSLKIDRKNYARQLEKAKTDAEIKGLEARIKNHDDRIAVYEKHGEVIHRFLAQLEEIEGALENSYLELVNLSQGREIVETSASINRLEQTVQAARRVEEKLRGEDTSEEDQAYLEAGRKLRQ